MSDLHGFIHKLQYGTFSPSEILPIIGGKKRHPFMVEGQSFSVRVNSKRLRTFSRSQVCYKCGLVGDLFVLEACNKIGNPHLNLYAVNGNSLVLMTVDHYVPRSKGGKDVMSNLRTMCSPCNWAKGDMVPENETEGQ